MYWTIFIVTCQLAGFLTSLRAIAETRTSQGAIAWAIALNAFPYLALPAYWVFGKSKFLGYVNMRRSEIFKIRPSAERLLAQIAAFRLPADIRKDEAILLERLAKLPFTTHNRARLLVDGEATFDAIVKGIEAATDYVLIQFYIIREDELGFRLRDVLLAKVATGVRCMVLYDEIGSGRLNRLAEKLTAGGVEIAPFDTTKGFVNRFQLNFRNHRKIVIIDGKTAYVGGHNIGNEYLGKNSHMGAWRDTHVVLQGPVVQCVQICWIEDWQWAKGEVPQLNWQPHAAPTPHCFALCLPSGPADDLETATLFFLFAINSAKERLWIATPYFVPDEQFISALQLAALRGVDVRILIPEKPDSELVRLSAFSYLAQTVPLGIRWFRYQQGFMHQKVMLVDQDYAAVGTANFDNRSFRLNFEITMAFADHTFAREVEAMLEKDFARSREVDPKEITEAGWWFQLKVRIARLLSPLQ